MKRLIEHWLMRDLVIPLFIFVFAAVGFGQLAKLIAMRKLWLLVAGGH